MNMKLKNSLIMLAGAAMLFSCQPGSNAPLESKNVDAAKDLIPQKVEELMQKMTLAEKVGQTNMYNGTWEFTGPIPADENSQQKAENIKKGMVGAMINVLTSKGTREAQRMAVEESRLGIPLLFGYDVIHGYQTMFPVPIAQAASWDFEAAKLASQVAAKETASSGVHWTFSPMIDVSQDARFGRIMEGAGEDPYLTSVMAKAWIEGYQGNDLANELTIAACAKHFAGYAFAEAGRDYNTADISRQTLYNVVLPPFKAAVEAGAATFMNSFNDVDGIPATGNAHLQRDLLKGEWRFDGMVVSDWGSIGEMLTHGYAADSKHAAILAMNAGSDMDMESRIYEGYLEEMVNSGKVDIKILDDAVRRILTLKYRMGLFDDPYKYCDEEREKQNVYSEENLNAARDVARKSIVLLKNENEILPIGEKVKSIAVIGQLAGSKDVPLGNWRAQAIKDSGISLFEGIAEAAGEGVNVTYAEGYKLTEGRRTFIHELNFVKDDEAGFAKAIALAKKSDLVVVALGEDCFQTGEGRSQADVRLRGSQLKMYQELLKVNKNIVVVLMNGRPLAIPEVAESAAAIVDVWFGGSQGGYAAADVLFGKYNPSGKLPVSFPYHVGQEPLHYNRKNTGRPVTNDFDNGLVFWSHYTDMTNEALFPFGFGLSYTKFDFSDFSAEVKGKTIVVKAKVKNVGQREGKETAQVYIWDKVASVTQPNKRLVDFSQISLTAGEEKALEFTLTEEDLGFYTDDYQFITESGEFIVMIGPDSRKLQAVSVQF